MKWVLAGPQDGAAALAEGTGLHPLIAQLLVNRGITEPGEALSFLSCDLSALSDPFIFNQMEKAVCRVRTAISGKEKIVVYGDYDVDGVTGASLLCLALKGLGAFVECYIPDRMHEGYGLNGKALETIKKKSGAQLVISVDCGITAVREAEAALSLGLDLIITDHHEFTHQETEATAPGPGPVLPRAYAILHPGLLSSEASARMREQVGVLTGVGVAFKLAQALLGVSGDDARLASCLDLVALGTIADVGRLTGENRILVRHGLEALSSDAGAQRPGIAALKKVAGLMGKKIGVGAVGFTLAPRINASGRLERAETAFRLLTTESPEEALVLASALDAVNTERQSVEERIRTDAQKLCGLIDAKAAGALVLCSEEWHPGVIGIVASRIVEEFYRPTALICVKDGIGKGSARSIPGFNLFEGLAACSDLLMGFGGHKYAAGFTIAKDAIPRFRERLSSIVLERLGPEGFTRTLSVEGAVGLDELTPGLLREMEGLAPFGQGNPEPRLGARGLGVVSSRIVGNNHLKLRLRQQGGATLDAIAFNRGELLGKQVRDGVRLAAVFTPRLNMWNGKTTVEMDIRDIKNEKEGFAGV